ncbi:protein RER1A-like [Iris pallida]|uniref:Protein RER1A-like n=1 Tax=Iris pallida TaxID=29817 RepID=A0AAX6GWD2_IRIPA|nr:protein RER1A-like [Iris pallida]
MMDPSSSSGDGAGIPFISAWIAAGSRRFQHLLDKATPHVLRRWLGLGLVAAIYVLRVAVVQGFYVVSYALGIYVLNLLIAFLSPQVDPEIQELVDGSGPSLPTRSSDEFRPFVRRLPEFKFWYSIMKAFFIAFVLTFFDAFDVPVFLAYSSLLLVGTLYGHNEAANTSYDKIQIRSLHHWKAALWEEGSSN